MSDQLEIISANGQIEFYVLDSSEGVINIGQHPDNDIVIPDPTIEPFCAIINYQQEPYQLVFLTPPYETRSLNYWDKLEFGSYTVILLKGEYGQTTTSSAPVIVPGESTSPSPTLDISQPTAPAPTVTPPDTQPPPTSRLSATAPVSGPTPSPPQPATLSPPSFRPEGANTVQAYTPSVLPPETTISSGNGNAAGQLDTLPPDQPDDIIRVQLSQKEWQVNTDETAVCEITITNAGQRVGSFAISVWGLDENWLGVSHPFIKLNERETGMISLTITPPRLPTSQAGPHYFAILVTSTTYPNRVSQHGATLTINPYYEFSVEELWPKRQTLSWGERSGQVTLPITNTGNSATLFRLEGINDERACRFEFNVPGETTALATQAHLRLYPEESIAVPIHISPFSRRLIAFRKRSYPYTITVTLPDDPQRARSMPGELKHKPLIGPWSLLLFVILFMVGFVFLFMPGPNPRLFKPDQDYIVEASDNPITLGYNVSRFKGLNPTNFLNTINAALLDVTVERKISGANDSTYEAVGADLEAPFGMVSDSPTLNVVYRLTVDNFLSKFLFSGLQRQTTQRISVGKQPPVITLSANRSEITLGETAILTWTQQYATKLEIKTIEGIPIDTIDSPESDGTFTVTPDSDTTYRLEAHNIYTENDDPVEVAVAIKVVVPTPTPTPTGTPSIAFFTANPPTIVEGEVATLRWRVNGVPNVTIDGIDETIPLPSEHSIEVRPTASTDYILSVPGVPELVPLTVRLDVLQATPTPTPEPGAPVISFFDPDKTEIVKGDSTEVTLSWSVVGETTNIELSSAALPNPIANLPSDGDFTISIDDTTLFVLTAFNGPAKASDTAQIDTTDPTPTPEPTAPPVVPSIGTFTAEPLETVTTCSGDFHVELDWTIRPPLGSVDLFQDGMILDQGTPQELRPPYVVTFTLAAGENPTPSFGLTAWSDTFIEKVEASPATVDLPPVAIDDSGYSTNESTPITISDVAANDCDPPTSPITSYSLSIATPPLKGTAVVNGTNIDYSPTGPFSGNDSDSFTYSICDSAGQCDTATVTIQVDEINDPPTANPDNYTVLEDAPLSLTGNVRANDTDPETATTDLMVISNTPPTLGTLTGAVINPDGSFEYTPTANQCGTDTFEYTIQDDGTPIGVNESSTGTVTIEIICVNDGPPVLTVNNLTRTCTTANPSACNNGGTVDDPDITETSVTLSASIGSVDPQTVNTSASAGTDSWTWTNNISTPGIYTVIITAQDSESLSTIASFVVTVN